MLPKKYPKADLNRYSSLFFVIGLAISLFTVWRLLELKVYDKPQSDGLSVVEVMDNIDEAVPMTQQLNTPPPPPPPSAPDVIEIVDDVDEVEETVIESTESSQEKFVEDAVVQIDDIQVAEEEEEVEVPFSVIEHVPVYPGCEKYASEKDRFKCFNDKVLEHIKQNLIYPQTAQDMGISGRVSITFNIDNKGRVADIQKRGPDRMLEAEAERIIKLLPQMKPGTQRGKAVKVNYGIPINFVLQK